MKYQNLTYKEILQAKAEAEKQITEVLKELTSKVGLSVVAVYCNDGRDVKIDLRF